MLEVALPGSVLSTEHSLREKTLKAGFIARALAVYRVDAVVVYEDPDTEKADADLLYEILRYLMAPPHLRKALVPLKPELRYAGLLPPVQTPRHLPPAEPEPGAVLDALIVERRGRSCRVTLGRLGEAVLEPCSHGERELVTVRITSTRPLRVEPASWQGVYVGYKTRRAGSIEAVARDARRRGLRVVATSRYGDCVRPDHVKPGRRGLLVAFGGPYRGLLEYTPPSLYDAIVNTVPVQGSLTVRTEEALHATLAIINLQWHADTQGR